MIILTGATGKLGAAIANRLIETHPDLRFGVSTRDPAKAEHLVERGVRVRRGDYDDPASLRHAFEGASQILLVSSNTTQGSPLPQHRNAIKAAQAVGAARIFYTSHMGAHAGSLFPPMRNHAATEAMLRESGLEFTSLRNGFYADSGLQFMGDFAQTGHIVGPRDGPVGWTTHEDLAAIAAVALTQPGAFDGITPPLTASDALDLADLAALAAEITGKNVERVTAEDEPFRAGMIERGAPAKRVEIAMGFYAASRSGEFAATDPTLARLLGRAPISMRDFLAESLVA